MLYGPISSTTWWGDEVSPQQFKDEMDALGDIDELHVYINSDGGDVFAGQAIRTILKRHKAKKFGHVDGLAASIASVVLTACDVVSMPINAMQMVHNPLAGLLGYYYAKELVKMAEDLEAIKESIILAYVDKTGLSKDEVSGIMDSETWLTAEEAVKLGFADEIEGERQIAASMDKGHLIMNGQKFDLSRFNHPPKWEEVAIRNIDTKNEGRTLSTANENRIRQANDLLNEVLNQIGEGTSNKEDPVINNPTPQRQPPLFLFQAQIQANRNKTGGMN